MDVPRYEVNRQVRTVLIRYDVDLSLLDYSFIGGTVYLSGKILRRRDEEFTPSGIEELAREITRLSGVRDVQFDLHNWIIASSGFSWQITKSDRKTPETSGAMFESNTKSTDDTIKIDKGETIAEVMKDLSKKKSDIDRER